MYAVHVVMTLDVGLCRLESMGIVEDAPYPWPIELEDSDCVLTRRRVGSARSACPKHTTHEWIFFRLSTQVCGANWSGAQLHSNPTTTPGNKTWWWWWWSSIFRFLFHFLPPFFYPFCLINFVSTYFLLSPVIPSILIRSVLIISLIHSLFCYWRLSFLSNLLFLFLQCILSFFLSYPHTYLFSSSFPLLSSQFFPPLLLPSLSRFSQSPSALFPFFDCHLISAFLFFILSFFLRLPTSLIFITSFSILLTPFLLLSSFLSFRCSFFLYAFLSSSFLSLCPSLIYLSLFQCLSVETKSEIAA